MLGPVGLEVQAHPFDGVQDVEELSRIRRRQGASPFYEGGADEPKPATGECVARHGAGFGRQARDFLPDGRTQLGKMSGGFLGPRGMLDDPLPLRFGPEHRLAERIPERRRHRARGRPIRIPDPCGSGGVLGGPATLPGRAGQDGLRYHADPGVSSLWNSCLSISRYRVVRSMLARRAAFDMFPPARLIRRVRYSFSNWTTTRSLAGW